MAQGIITVVGGTGFLGKYVVRDLARQGFMLRVLSRDARRGEGLKPLGDAGQIVSEYADLTCPHTLEKKLAGSFGVVNLVGILFERGRENFSAVHAQGAEKLAQAAHAAGVERYVHVSALGVDRAAESKYARTKLLGERATCSAFSQATVLRPGVLFGAGDHFFSQFAWMSCYAPFLPLIGGGKTRFQPVYAADVARAVTQSLQMPERAGKIYELGGTEVFTFRELMEFVCAITRRPPRFLSLPFPAAHLLATLLELLPSPPLTRDQVRLLRYDNVVSSAAPNFSHLGIVPTSARAVVPEYLSRFVRSCPDPVLA
jgi:NADH dehydrogenase